MDNFIDRFYGVTDGAGGTVFVAILAGFIDSLAGGGGLLTVPP
jgi:hypothetical protein